MISLEFMDRVEMLRDLEDEHLEAVRQIAESAEYKKGDCIFKHGQPAEYLWIIAEGGVELRCEPGPESRQDACEPVTFASAAQAFGWTCFVPPYSYRMSGYCASRRCSLIKLPRQGLENLFEKYPEIGLAVMQYTMKAIGTQFQELQDEIAKRRGQEIMNRW